MVWRGACWVHPSNNKQIKVILLPVSFVNRLNPLYKTIAGDKGIDQLSTCKFADAGQAGSLAAAAADASAHHFYYASPKKTEKSAPNLPSQAPCHQISLQETVARLGQPGIHIDAATYVALMRWCRDAKALSNGKHIHIHIIKSDLQNINPLESLIIHMYDQCDAVEDALAMFSDMRQRNVYACNFIIRAYVRQGQSQEALQLFNQMLEEGVLPNQVTYVSILSLNASQETLAEGKRIHIRILESEFKADVIVGTALVNMYGKCGSLKDAHMTFNTMPEVNVVSWTAMMALYAQHGMRKKAFQVFNQMLSEGFVPNRVSFISILAACVGPAALCDGKCMHVYAFNSGFETHVSLGNALINMYSKCGSIEDAQNIFDNMSQRDVVSWTGMIGVYAKQGKTDDALKCFHKMQQDGIEPNRVTFISTLAAFSSQATLAEGKQLHRFIVFGGFELELSVGNALVSMYGKCGNLEDARTTFRKMLERDVASWNSMIAAYAEHGKVKGCLRLLNHMQRKGISPDKFSFVTLLGAVTSPAALAEGRQVHACIWEFGFEQDVLVSGALINMYGKCGNVKDAQNVFDNMPDRDVVSWNSIISVHGQHGHSQMALELFYEMQRERIMPDRFTIISILTACACTEFLAQGKRLHIFIIESGYDSDEVIGSSLVTMYGKCNSLEDARRVFYKMPKPKVGSWTAMIGVLAQHGQGKEAFQLFDQMQQKGVVPDIVNFVTILAACASQATVAEGRHVHACIVDRGLESGVIVGNALINMHGKCGNLKDALWVFNKMPERDTVSWNAMIAIYANHGHGKKAFQLLDFMERDGILPDKVTFVNILSACSHAGLVEEAQDYFDSMEQDHGISPDVDHYVCMIDLLGRAGLLDEAERLIFHMPMQPTAVPFMALLGACQFQADLKRGERVANHVFELDPENAAPYVVLSNLYAGAGREDDAAKVIQSMRVEWLKQ